jgi:hypothetical protein
VDHDGIAIEVGDPLHDRAAGLARVDEGDDIPDPWAESHHEESVTGDERRAHAVALD